ncbi:MAG TPA: HAD family phosphatase [Thermoanaerobaculia bacterium]|nr:HAD family phosphatase [Thermoanaerobaculia bacterium]
MKSIAAAIFDFDETIIDLEPQHTAAYAAVCRAMGSDYWQLPESFRKRSGSRIVDDIRDMRTHFGWTPSVDELMSIRLRAFDELCRTSSLELLPGAEKTIRDLHDLGIPLAIATSAVASSIDLLLRRFDLRDCFDLIVDGSDVVHGKPDPEAYLVSAKKLGVDARECVVFEDSHVGVLAAKRAGAYCVAVPNRHAQEHQDLSMADLVLDSFERLDVRTAFAPKAR